MALADLLNGQLIAGASQAPTGLADTIAAGTDADINRQAGNAAQAINENTFGRGLGLSTVSGYLQGQNELARSTALAKARSDATLASVQAQQASLAQAAGQVNQQAQRENQASIANKQALATGVGGLAATGAGLGGLIFGRDIRSGVRGMMGLDGNAQQNSMLPMDQRPGSTGGLADAGSAAAPTPGALPSSATGDAGAFTPGMAPAPAAGTEPASVNFFDTSSPAFDVGGAASGGLSDLFNAAGSSFDPSFFDPNNVNFQDFSF